MKYVLALDQGTTSSRAAIVGEDGKIVCILNREFPQIYPREGWVEHDPMDIWSSQYGIMMEAIAKSGISVEDIASIGITNQRETTIVWEKATGKPVYNAIVWQCRRTAERIEEIVKSGAGESIREKTGLIPDAYFSASKIEWYGGFVSCVETDGRKSARHRSDERRADDAFQYPHHAVG